MPQAVPAAVDDDAAFVEHHVPYPGERAGAGRGRGAAPPQPAPTVSGCCRGRRCQEQGRQRAFACVWEWLGRLATLMAL